MKALSIILSYLIGSISTAYLVVKYTQGVDIRTVGSKNAGATNVLRTAGLGAALLVFFLDIFKGILAVNLGKIMGGEITSLLCGIAVIVGHNWPLYFGLKGGKGSATSIGVIFATMPVIGMIIILIGVVTVIITRYVSLGTIVVAPIFPILVLSFGKSREHVLFAIIMMVLSLYRHKANILRLRQGTESKLGHKLKEN